MITFRVVCPIVSKTILRNNDPFLEEIRTAFSTGAPEDQAGLDWMEQSEA
jgi:hypothetical protein